MVSLLDPSLLYSRNLKLNYEDSEIKRTHPSPLRKYHCNNGLPTIPPLPSMGCR
jgi:hypothetical protein